ncbi:MAG: CobQ/CobB/MinD/ParA nucleotide binding domain [Saliniramus fredricksonii]|uniref:CobQ/CobB/MinD/ParA nucleotide binding domain n=1 Tax=Saliniramus fredricksonii TaxID=1653334 RepID=A0A0P7X3U4_9HYPH|nr:ParA family protein [Saliniramus fredricksonii]KPQ09259.1 MAG: CobQ/CobB/MinD/ParA nucleotide binding domain [Saliniramus fredricksonii]SCC82096.1 CobQ/CobB/MinD/ParA nucleotide binding domain-containing protein [Saliniramus fredricksonii]
MKSITFFNNKGGVGKTTLLCNLAAYFATEMHMNVLVIDADPQCNATQYMFDDKHLSYLYDETSTFTIYSVVRPLAQGRGYSKEVKIQRSKNFGVDVIPGDPRLALTEDLLARDWGSATSGDTRGIRTSVLFLELLQRYKHYDLVFFDVGPSLGSINRAVLLGSDYFLSPMSTDIFSLKAIENIATWFADWTKKWKSGLENSDADEGDIPVYIPESVTFLGYVTQQYMAKKDTTGNRRPVSAYEKIISQVDNIIRENFHGGINLLHDEQNYNLGTIPNLFSLIPLSQSSRKPIFSLASGDGVRGAHFAKVKDSKVIFSEISRQILNNLEEK